MAHRQPLIAGNWKLNGSRQSAVELATAVSAGCQALSAEVLVCPVSVHINDVRIVVESTSVKLGAQNCSDASDGAFTGEVSANMLSEFGCEYIILGHSERRAMFHETSALVASKCVAVQAAGLIPILCVGETLEQREAGEVEAVIAEQLDAVLDAAGINGFDNMVVAYEPVWAIGTGKTASPEQAQEVHALIRAKIATGDKAIADKLRILYGGSVKPRYPA